jgi:uncharacterized protein
VNVVRFLPTIGGYAYAHEGHNVYVNQYVGSHARIVMGKDELKLTQETQYPWEGAVKLTVQSAPPQTLMLHLRIPSWAQGPQSPDDLYRVDGKPEQGAVRVTLNGQPLSDLNLHHGYARLERTWRDGDVVTLQIPMPVQRVRAHPKVQMDAGRVALQRGPVVYCLEGVDNPSGPRHFALPPASALAATFRPDLLGGVAVLKGQALLSTQGSERPESVPFTAVPYYAWDNRAAGQMVVWLPEDPAGAEAKSGK